MLYTLPFKGRNYISSAYGYRVLNGKREFHAGWDIVGRDSTDIEAACPGTVRSSTIITNRNDLTWQWGNYVKVRDGSGRDLFACHMASRAVAVGRTVNTGDKLGVMGETGYCFGAHTHWEARASGGVTICPGELFGLPNTAGVVWDRAAMEAACIGYLDCTAASYRWRLGAGTTYDLYRPSNTGACLYCRVGVTYRVYAVVVLPGGEVWCQVTPPEACADGEAPVCWVSAACGQYTAKEAPAASEKPEDSGSTVPEPSGPEGTEPESNAPDRPVDWDSDGNEFIVSASRGDRPALREVCERLALPVKNA